MCLRVGGVIKEAGVGGERNKTAGRFAVLAAAIAVVIGVSVLLAVAYDLYPEIDVQRPEGTSIPDGGTDDVGTQPLGTLYLTYTIDNTAGTTSLVVQTDGVTVSGYINCSGFNALTPLPLEISLGETDALEVSFDVDGDGAFSLDMDILSNDPDESPYDIHLTGTADGDPPDVSDITLADADPTNASSVDFTVTFDESVTGVDTTDFAVDASGIVDAAIDAVSGGGTTWTVTVGTGTGDGTLSIDLTDDDSIEDDWGNALGGSGAGNGDFTAGAAYTIDKTPPSVPDGLLPSDGTTVNTSTPTLSWNASTDEGGSGLRTTNTYRYQVSGPSPKDDYTTNTHYTPTLNDGVYTWKIYARDNAGNNSDWSEENTLTVDTDPPAVSSVAVDTDPMYEGDLVQQVTVTFDEAMDTGTDPTITFGAGTFTSNSDGAWSVGDKVWTETYTLTDNDETITGVTVDVAGAKDAAGNGQEDYTPEGEFDIDTMDPEIQSVTSTTPDGLYGIDAEINVTVTFTEQVTLYGGTLNFLLNVATPQYEINVSPFDDSTVASTTYTVLEGHSTDDLDSTSVSCDGTVRDAAGNETNSFFIPATSIADGSDIEIEATRPTVEGLSTSAYCDRRIFVVFDEAMLDADASPTNYTIADAGAGTLAEHPDSVAHDSGNWYLLTWNTGEMLDGSWLTITVENVHDLAGNLIDPAANSSADLGCAVLPSVSGVTAFPTQIDDATVGTDTFTVTVVFDETMDTGTVPNLVFAPDVAAGGTPTLSSGSGAWSTTTHTNDTFAMTYDVADRNVDVDSVTVDVTGAKDAAGNPQNDYTPEAEFDIDTENPWVSAITSTTSNGYYNVGAAIDVTMNFSESVTLAGASPQLKVDLDSGATDVLLAVPAGAASTNGTYTVGAGENSCDLNVETITVNGTIRDAAGNDLDPTKTLATMSTDNLADYKDITVDTTDPVVGAIGITAGDDQLDANCKKTVSYAVTITDNCCIDLDASPIVVTPSATNATTSGLTMNLTPGTGKVTSVVVSGTFVVSVIDACATVPSVQVDVEDCAGNTATRTDTGPTVSDGTAPTFLNFAVTPTDGIVDTNCEETVSFSVDVHDNCSIDLDDPTTIVVTESATNASTSGLAWSVDKAGLQSDFTITGSFTVESLTGCPAIPAVEVRVTDLCGNAGTASQDGAGIEDDIVPVIHDLVVEGHVVVDDCCEGEIEFSAYVTDNCCVAPDGITIVPTNPTGNLTIDFDQAQDVTIVQNGQGRVDISGVVPVRCVTSCPAIVKVTVEANDCCGNSAVPVSSTASETDPNETGHVYDETEPIPRDDPRQDVVLEESAIIDPLVEVRLDEFGVYRLLFREDTPARIDVVANDADNCSCEDCAHPFDPCGSCGACSGCCATLYIHEIVGPPAYGTATIEDAEGDCGGGSVIRYAPDLGYVGPDEFTYRIRDACGNVSSVVATVYVETIPKVSLEDVYVTACSGEPTAFMVNATDLWLDDEDLEEVPFTFDIVGGPEHGVVVGDPLQVTYAPPSTVDVGGTPVPTLDFLESAEIELTYTSATGYVGRDVVQVRFADPFGNETTGWVDIAVIECAPGEAGIPQIVVTQGEILPIIVPEGFTAVIETAWGSVLLIDLADGTEYSEALSVAYSEAIHRHVIYVDTGSLPLGRHLLVVPLGNGEAVELTIEVCAPDL